MNSGDREAGGDDSPALEPRRTDALITPETCDRYRSYRLRTFSLTWAAYAIFYLCRKNISVVKNRLSKERGLTNTQLGNIDTGLFTGYAVGQFITGSLGDQIGGKRLITIGLFSSALLNLWFSVETTPLLFLIAWTLNGLAQSTGWPGSANIFSRWFARDERGTVMGVWCTCYQFGPIFSTLVATWLLGSYGWQSAFFIPALIVAGYALFFLFFQKAAPQQEGLPHVEVYYAQIKGGDGSKITPASDESSFWENVSHVIKSRPLWTLGLTYVVLKFIRYTLMFWLPLYMGQQLGYPDSEAGYSSLVFDMAGVLGTIFAGFVSDRFFQSRRAPVIVIMISLLAVATYFFTTFSAMGRMENLAAIALIGFLLYGPDSITSGVAAVDFGHRRAAGLAAGFVNGMGSIGATLSGVVAGRLSEARGWEAVFALFAPLCVAGAVLMCTMWNTIPEGKKPPQR